MAVGMGESRERLPRKVGRVETPPLFLPLPDSVANGGPRQEAALPESAAVAPGAASLSAGQSAQTPPHPGRTAHATRPPAPAARCTIDFRAPAQMLVALRLPRQKAVLETNRLIVRDGSFRLQTQHPAQIHTPLPAPVSAQLLVMGLQLLFVRIAVRHLIVGDASEPPFLHQTVWVHAMMPLHAALCLL